MTKTMNKYECFDFLYFEPIFCTIFIVSNNFTLKRKSMTPCTTNWPTFHHLPLESTHVPRFENQWSRSVTEGFGPAIKAKNNYNWVHMLIHTMFFLVPGRRTTMSLLTTSKKERSVLFPTPVKLFWRPTKATQRSWRISSVSASPNQPPFRFESNSA